MKKIFGWLADGRGADRLATRPPGLTYWTTDRPPPLPALFLALQHLAIQSVYIVLPAAMAASLTSDPATITRFVSLSLAATALAQVLQLLPRGPVGAGYPIPGCSAPPLLGAYALLGTSGGGFEAAAAMVVLSGLFCIALAALLRRPRLVLPNELAAVVVILIGVAVLNLGAQQLGLQRSGTLPDDVSLEIVLATLVAIAGIALSRTRAAPFAVLLGGVFGTLLGLALGQLPDDAGAVLAAQPWFAPPQPWTPRFEELTLAPTLSFLVAMVAVKATIFGSLVVFQRAADAGWTRPDAPPIRRGLFANGIGITLAGMIGGAVPGPATAALGLSVATGTLARRIVWIGAGLLLVLAFCPKLVTLFVVVPNAVKAAMLIYVAGFILAQGCALVAARLLDTRRTIVVAAGLAAGLLAAIAPQAFVAGLPALSSPLALGAVVALFVHLVTLPLVARSASLTVMLGAGMGSAREVTEWFGRVGGAWGLKAQTRRAVDHALTELADLLATRGVTDARFGATVEEDRVVVTLAWAGEALPPRSARPRAEDLLESTAAQEGFAVWLATREAQAFSQRATDTGTEARLVFED